MSQFVPSKKLEEKSDSFRGRESSVCLSWNLLVEKNDHCHRLPFLDCHQDGRRNFERKWERGRKRGRGRRDRGRKRDNKRRKQFIREKNEWPFVVSFWSCFSSLWWTASLNPGQDLSYWFHSHPLPSLIFLSPLSFQDWSLHPFCKDRLSFVVSCPNSSFLEQFLSWTTIFVSGWTSRVMITLFSNLFGFSQFPLSLSLCLTYTLSSISFLLVLILETWS